MELLSPKIEELSRIFPNDSHAMAKNILQWAKGIYLLQIPGDPRVYIGATRTTFRNRYKSHLSALNGNCHRNTKIQNEFNKTKHFEMYVLEIIENSKLFKKAEKKWIKHFSPNIYNSKSGPGIRNLGNPNTLKTIWQVRNTENNRRLICHSDFSTSIKLKCDLENNCYRNRLLQSDFNNNKDNIVFEIVTKVPRKDFEKTLYDLKSTLQEQDYGKIPEDYPILLYSVA